MWRPPGSARDVEMFGLIVPADRDAIDALLARDFARPSRGALDYRCAHHHVVVTFGDIRKETSLDSVDEKRGFVHEREVSIWCLVADARTGHLRWYLPYVYTDSEQTVATGREIFGYPKQMGYFAESYPKELRTHGTTVVQTMAIHRFGPKSELTRQDLLSVRRVRRAANQSPVTDFVTALWDFFPGDEYTLAPAPTGPVKPPSVVIIPKGAKPPRTAGGTAPWITGVRNAISHNPLRESPAVLLARMIENPTLVFLKQFRDAGSPTRACYQAVIEAQLKMQLNEASRLVPLNPDLFALTIADHDSDPIAAELGLEANTPIAPEAAFHARFGFDIDFGFEVWKAQT